MNWREFQAQENKRLSIKSNPDIPKSMSRQNETLLPSINLSTATVSRARHQAGQMNGLEKRYAQYLEVRRITGEIQRYMFEPLKIKLANATFYNPDFYVVMADGSIEIHETKGHWEDDSRVKIKIAARMFPEIKFVGVQWLRRVKEWKFEEFPR